MIFKLFMTFVLISVVGLFLIGKDVFGTGMNVSLIEKIVITITLLSIIGIPLTGLLLIWFE